MRAKHSGGLTVDVTVTDEPLKGETIMKLVMLNYKTRDLGYGSEEGCVHAYLTNEVDTWGKRTVMVLLADGDLQPWYLFPDEYSTEDI